MKPHCRKSYHRRHSNSTGSRNATGSSKSNTAKMVQRILSCGNEKYYDILQVRRTATVKEIKGAYKKLILVVHPDKTSTPGAKEATQKLNIARTALLNQVRQGNKHNSTSENQQSRRHTANNNNFSEQNPQSSYPRRTNRRSASNRPQRSNEQNSSMPNSNEQNSSMPNSNQRSTSNEPRSPQANSNQNLRQNPQESFAAALAHILVLLPSLFIIQM